MVSVASIVSEGPSLVEVEANESETPTLPLTEAEEPTKTGRGVKKGGKTKKPPAKPKKKAGVTKIEDIPMTYSFIEPEVDTSVARPEETQPKSGRNKKRSSDKMNEGNDEHRSENVIVEEASSQPPPAKRRATRSSVMASDSGPLSVLQDAHDVAMNMTDAKSMPPPPPPISKKAGKKGKKRASATTRKASSGARKAPVIVRRPSATSRAASTASVVSPRSTTPEDDDDIDAALEAELNRPLTDDEMEIENSDIEYPRIVKIKMTKPEIEKLEIQQPQIQQTEIEVQRTASQPEVRQPEVRQPEVGTPSRRSSSQIKLDTKDSSIPRVLKTPRKSPNTNGRVHPGESDKENNMAVAQAYTDPWTPVEFEKLFLGSPVAENNDPFTTFSAIIESVKDTLPSSEKVMSIEDWIQHKAKQAEERLRNECERLVWKFEGEGMRALRTLEGISCVD